MPIPNGTVGSSFVYYGWPVTYLVEHVGYFPSRIIGTYWKWDGAFLDIFLALCISGLLLVSIDWAIRKWSVALDVRFRWRTTTIAALITITGMLYLNLVLRRYNGLTYGWPFPFLYLPSRGEDDLEVSFEHAIWNLYFAIAALALVCYLANRFFPGGRAGGKYQIHLLTIVAMVLVSGVLLLANLEFSGWPCSVQEFTGYSPDLLSMTWIFRLCVLLDALVGVSALWFSVMLFEAFNKWTYRRVKADQPPGENT